jgi:hypothetical protein
VDFFLLSEQARVDTQLGAHHHHSRYFHADSVGDVLRLRLQLHPQVNPRPQNHEGECRAHIFYLSLSHSLDDANAAYPQWMGARVEFDSPYPLTPNRTHALSKRFADALLPTQALRKSDFGSCNIFAE